MRPNKALQLTPSRITPLFTTGFQFLPCHAQLQPVLGVAEPGVGPFIPRLKSCGDLHQIDASRIRARRLPILLLQ